MRTAYGNRGNSIVPALAGGGVLLCLVLATGGYGWSKGWFVAKRPAPVAFVPPEGTIPVPITTQAIPAYTRLTRDHFIDRKTGTFSVMYLYPNEIGPDMKTKLNDVLNRVLKSDKKVGYAVTEGELLEKGTRPGLSGGVPPGKRALVLEASRIHGIHGLNRGDHIDLVASVTVDVKPPTGRDARSILLSLKPSDSALGTAESKKKARVIVLAEDAVIISPPTIRYLPPTTAPKPRAPEAKGKPIEEVVIAVDPEDVVRVNEGLGVDATITAVAHSGRPENSAAKSSIKPVPPPPVAPPTAIETIRGGKRVTVFFAPDGTRLTEAPGTPGVVATGSDAPARR